MSSRKFISKVEAQKITDDANDDRLAIPVGEKFMIVPPLPEAYKNKQGRIVRANLRMHINNFIDSKGLEPCELPKPEEAAKAKPSDILTQEMIEALDALVADGFDLEKENLADIKEATGLKITGALRMQYLSR